MIRFRKSQTEGFTSIYQSTPDDNEWEPAGYITYDAEEELFVFGPRTSAVDFKPDDLQVIVNKLQRMNKGAK